MLADPNLAAVNYPTVLDDDFLSSYVSGRNSTSFLLTAIGPIPGPPPPWGILNVLCKFKWQTSAPKNPGLVNPL